MTDLNSVCFFFSLLLLSEIFHQVLDEQPPESSREQLSAFLSLLNLLFLRTCPVIVSRFGAFASNTWNGTPHLLLISREDLHSLSSRQHSLLLLVLTYWPSQTRLQDSASYSSPYLCLFKGILPGIFILLRILLCAGYWFCCLTDRRFNLPSDIHLSKLWFRLPHCVLHPRLTHKL